MKRRRETMNKFLGAAATAEIFGVTRRTVTRWYNEGKFPGASKLNESKQTSPIIIPKDDINSLKDKRILQNIHFVKT